MCVVAPYVSPQARLKRWRGIGIGKTGHWRASASGMSRTGGMGESGLTGRTRRESASNAEPPAGPPL